MKFQLKKRASSHKSEGAIVSLARRRSELYLGQARAATVFIAPSGRRKNRFPGQKEALASANMALGPRDPSGRKRMRASPDHQCRYVTEKTSVSPAHLTKTHPQSASNPRPNGGRGRIEAVFALSLSLFPLHHRFFVCYEFCCCAEQRVL